jgi:DNA polymerase III alpha subunit (gram-positive type)
MSTLTGTANFAQEKLPSQYLFYAPVVIGCINILAGIITTVQQFLHITELYESHRVSTIAWDKFYRRIKHELSRKPAERTPISEFMLTATEEYDRLIETSPSIDKDIVATFKSTFDGSFTNQNIRSMFNELTKPDILDTLVSIRKSIYKNPEDRIKETISTRLQQEMGSDNNIVNQYKKIQEFSTRFRIELSREPTRKEYIDNLEDIPVQFIDTFLEQV